MGGQHGFFIGFLLFISAFIYLVVHFIKKNKNKEKVLSKKVFYSMLIGGFLLSIIGLSIDDSTIAELADVKEQNEELINENEDLTDINSSLKTEVEALKDKNTDLQNQLKTTKNELAKINEDSTNYESNIEELKSDIKQLTLTISEKDGEIESLKSEKAKLQNSVATANVQGPNASTNSGSSVTNNKNSPSTSNVVYDNCTHARNAGAAPVYEGDPGYGRHLDRDGDGVGCE
ncbi:excalibur calcium-binding domain-containing protein [Gracilibacillus sp. JCM 18860]|uniref:excalibur calcium-binding domain-containing protein n=1 Tax=Gracilibacillus sp. JCM 18860 TaxID=1306159 RepID=UPI0006D1BB4F